MLRDQDHLDPQNFHTIAQIWETLHRERRLSKQKPTYGYVGIEDGDLYGDVDPYAPRRRPKRGYK